MSGDLVSQRVADLMAAPREHGGRRVESSRRTDMSTTLSTNFVLCLWKAQSRVGVEGADYVLIDAPGSVPNRHTPQAVALTQIGYTRFGASDDQGAGDHDRDADCNDDPHAVLGA